MCQFILHSSIWNNFDDDAIGQNTLMTERMGVIASQTLFDTLFLRQHTNQLNLACF